jgi:hypothetical protein
MEMIIAPGATISAVYRLPNGVATLALFIVRYYCLIIPFLQLAQ